jgi:hypothetical protein
MWALLISRLPEWIEKDHEALAEERLADSAW